MYRTFIILLAAALLQCGCANEPVAGVAVAPGLVEPAKQEQGQQAGEQEGGITGKVTELMKKVQSKAPSLEDMKKMANDVGGATGKTANDTLQQINELYQSARDQGLEHTESISEWVASDWNGMNAWEYKVIDVDTNEMAGLEKALNEAGKERWDCFHVSESTSSTKFFMKRHRKSYLKNIPLKDLLILVPFLDNEK